MMHMTTISTLHSNEEAEICVREWLKVQAPELFSDAFVTQEILFTE